MANAAKHYDELPLTMSVEEMADVLGISRKVAYRIAKEQDLGLRIGEKRLIVPKHKLIAFLNK